MHPLPSAKVTYHAPQEDEIQGRYSKLSKQKAPCVHHHCGANSDQNRAQDEFDFLTHGNSFGKPSASTSNFPSGAAIIKRFPDVSPRLRGTPGSNRRPSPWQRGSPPPAMISSCIDQRKAASLLPPIETLREENATAVDQTVEPFADAFPPAALYGAPGGF